MAFVLKETTQEAIVIADSKASISQAESHKFTAAMHPIWNEVFEDRARLRLEWIKSHQLEEDLHTGPWPPPQMEMASQQHGRYIVR